MDFSSWPREQEQSFVVYEQHAKESQSKATMMAAIAGIGVFILLVGIYAGVEPERKDYTKDMNMSNLTKKHKAAAAEEQPAPKAEAPAPAPAAAPAAAPAEAPTDKK
jgi:hypothetical protein